MCPCACVLPTFSLCCRAVGVSQRQQGHLYQLIKQQVSFDQHKLSMFFFSLELWRIFLVLHHTEHRQEGSCVAGKRVICHNIQQCTCLNPSGIHFDSWNFKLSSSDSYLGSLMFHLELIEIFKKHMDNTVVPHLPQGICNLRPMISGKTAKE